MDDINSVILFQIDRTSKVSKLYSQKELDEKNLGITVDQWVLLKIIHESSPLSQKELAVKSLRDPASITRTLDLLEKRDFIFREAIEGNRRKYNIVLTTEGNQFVNDNMDMITRHRKQSTKGFTEAEMKQLRDMLLRIQKNMN
jgi:DNA-binding MarR family transcriptional regulator